MTYIKEIQKSMQFLAKNRNTLFLGQSVSIPGNLIFNSLNKVNQKKKIELPIFEDTQMGISIGLALNGFIPVTCYPRFDFFILSLNQSLHLLILNRSKPQKILKIKSSIFFKIKIS